jgi:hypothetical protein
MQRLARKARGTPTRRQNAENVGGSGRLGHVRHGLGERMAGISEGTRAVSEKDSRRTIKAGGLHCCRWQVSCEQTSYPSAAVYCVIP